MELENIVTRAHFAKWAENAWRFANSPIVITLVSGLLISAITRWYAEYDANRNDLIARSEKLDAALTELQQRLSYLQIGDKRWKTRCDLAVASEQEWQAITGGGRYIPSSPAYKNISITVVLANAQRSSGAWDPDFDASRWLGTFVEPPPMTALYVRTQLPWLQGYVSSRIIASSMSMLPLPKGQSASRDLNRLLNIPTLAESRKASDEQHRNAQLIEAPPNLPPCPTDNHKP